MKKIFKYVKNKNETNFYGKILSKFFFCKNIINFTGEIGIGKTTLIKNIIEKKIKYKKNIKSPSYKIINEYKYKEQNIFHLDFFKLESIKDMNRLNLNFNKRKKNLFFIEWGNKFKIKEIKTDIKIHILNYSSMFNRIILIKKKYINFKKLFG